MTKNDINTLNLYKKAVEIERIGNLGVQRVLEENRRLGIPIVFSKNGKIYYEIENGEITTKSPFKNKSLK